MPKKAQTVQGLKYLENKLFRLKSAFFCGFPMMIALELRSKRAARSTPVRRRARLERSALFFDIPFYASNEL